MIGVYHRRRRTKYRGTIYVAGYSANLLCVVWFDGHKIQVDLMPNVDLLDYKRVA